VSDALRFLLEAYTHFQNSNYLEAFVLSWLIIEKDTYARWNRYLEEKNIGNSRKRKLENPSTWTADMIIEQLSLAGRISSGDYQKLISMKAVRNRIVHRGERVSKEQADESLEFAVRIVTEEIVGLDVEHLPRSANSSLDESHSGK